eukprot:gene14678-20715_t
MLASQRIQGLWRSVSAVQPPPSSVHSCINRFASSKHSHGRGRVAQVQAVASSEGGSQDTREFKVLLSQLSEGKGKNGRLDAYLTTQMPDASRAKVQTAIKEGGVFVNGRPIIKTSSSVKHGDVISCTLPPQQPMEVIPEDIPLDIRYEDEYLMVVHKPAGMVTHTCVGHFTGTLVNALLHHCGVQAVQLIPSGNQQGAASINAQGSGPAQQSAQS